MPRFEASRELLGTQVSLILVADENLLPNALEECARIEAAFSRFIGGNELANLNAAAGDWTEVGPELFELLVFGERVRIATDGAFDLSVKSILDGWGYDSDYSLKEGAAGSTGKITAKCGYVKVEAPVDLGGLGKGYAIDRMKLKLETAEGLQGMLINAGGDIFASGVDENGAPWKVAFEHPSDPQLAIGTVNVDGFALASSSGNRRAWADKHHLVDPKSKRPADKMQAVYVQAPQAIVADAYATALFVMGYEKARKELSELPVEALLVATNGDLFSSEGFVGELF